MHNLAQNVNPVNVPEALIALNRPLLPPGTRHLHETPQARYHVVLKADVEAGLSHEAAWVYSAACYWASRSKPQPSVHPQNWPRRIPADAPGNYIPAAPVKAWVSDRGVLGYAAACGLHPKKWRRLHQELIQANLLYATYKRAPEEFAGITRDMSRSLLLPVHVRQWQSTPAEYRPKHIRGQVHWKIYVDEVREVGVQAALVLSHMRWDNGDSRQCKISYAGLAKSCCLTEQQARDAVTKLLKREWIARQSRHGKRCWIANRYDIYKQPTAYEKPEPRRVDHKSDDYLRADRALSLARPSQPRWRNPDYLPWESDPYKANDEVCGWLRFHDLWRRNVRHEIFMSGNHKHRDEVAGVELDRPREFWKDRFLEKFPRCPITRTRWIDLNHCGPEHEIDEWMHDPANRFAESTIFRWIFDKGDDSVAAYSFRFRFRTWSIVPLRECHTAWLERLGPEKSQEITSRWLLLPRQHLLVPWWHMLMLVQVEEEHGPTGRRYGQCDWRSGDPYMPTRALEVTKEDSTFELAGAAYDLTPYV